VTDILLKSNYVLGGLTAHRNRRARSSLTESSIFCSHCFQVKQEMCKKHLPHWKIFS